MKINWYNCVVYLIITLLCWAFWSTNIPVDSEVIMAKNRIHTKYQDDMFQPLPSVTTILSIISKPALVHAAWKLGCQNLDYKKVWGEKATIGTLTHAMIFDHLNKRMKNG